MLEGDVKGGRVLLHAQQHGGAQAAFACTHMYMYIHGCHMRCVHGTYRKIPARVSVLTAQGQRSCLRYANRT